MSFAAKRSRSEPHNSFDVVETDGKFVATSHNFPECVGRGKTREIAIDQMDRAIIYLKDNDPKRYIKNVKARLEHGLECGCGLPLEGQVMGVIGTPRGLKNA